MTKKKSFSDAEDSGKEGGGNSSRTANSRGHASTATASHSNARAVQLVSGHNGITGWRTGSTTVDSRPMKPSTAAPEIVGRASPQPQSVMGTNPVCYSLTQDIYASNSNNGRNSPQLQQQQPIRSKSGLAGLFGRKSRQKSSSAGDSSNNNSSSEGANSEMSENDDRRRKKSKQKRDKARLLTLLKRTESNGSRLDVDRPSTPTSVVDAVDTEQRRRRLNKLSLMMLSSDRRDAASTTSDSTDTHSRRNSQQLQQVQQLQNTNHQASYIGRAAPGHTLERGVPAAKMPLRTEVYEPRQQVAVGRTDSGLLQAGRTQHRNAGYAGCASMERGQKPHPSAVQRKDGPGTSSKNDSETITKYPKYKLDDPMSTLWMNGSGTIRPSPGPRVEYTIATARQWAIAGQSVEYSGPRELQQREESARDASNVDRQVSSAYKTSDAPRYEPGEVPLKENSCSFVGGHYAPIPPGDGLAQNEVAKKSESNDAKQLKRHPQLPNKDRAVVAEIHRSNSPDARNASTFDRSARLRHSSGVDAGRRRPTANAAGNSVERLKRVAPRNDAATVNGGDRSPLGAAFGQSKSVEVLSPRMGRRGEEHRRAPSADRKRTAAAVVAPAVADNNASDGRAQQQPMMMRTVTIKVTGKKDGGDANQRDQYDHLREKSSKHGKADTMNAGDELSRCAGATTGGGKLSSSLPDLKKDDPQATTADNVYRPKNGNLPRADSTDSLMLLTRKDQFDFLSEKDRNGKRDTIESIYWAGDTARSQTGSTCFFRMPSKAVPPAAAVSSTNTISSELMLLLSDGGGSECSSNSEPPPTPTSPKSDGRQSTDLLKKWCDAESYQTSYYPPRRPFLGSTERHRFVRRKTSQRTSTIEDLFGRFSTGRTGNNSDNDFDAYRIRAAPSVLSASTVVAVESQPPPQKVEKSVVQPVVTHDYAEVVSFFSCPTDGRSKRRVDDTTFVSRAVVTGSWQWTTSGGRRGIQQEQRPEKEDTVDTASDVITSTEIFHFRNVSRCVDTSSSRTSAALPIDRFRLVDGSVAPAGSRRRLAKAKSVSTTSKYSTDRSASVGTSPSRWSNDDDDGVVGYRRYLVSGSHPTTTTTTSHYRSTVNDTRRDGSSGYGGPFSGLWRSLWSSDSQSNIGYRSGDRSAVRSRLVSGREVTTGTNCAWTFAPAKNVCDYLAGMLLGMVVVLFVSYMQCNA